MRRSKEGRIDRWLRCENLLSRWSLMGKKTDPIVPIVGRLGLLGRFWKGIGRLRR